MLVDDFSIVKKTFRHGFISYSFFCKDITGFTRYTGNETVMRLFRYMQLVQAGRIPETIFNDASVPRASRMRVKNITKVQRAFLEEYLVENGHLTRLTPDETPIPGLVATVFKNFKDAGLKKKPSHEPVLNYVLQSDPRSVAIEVPVWKIGNRKCTSLTGHVDLLQIDDMDDGRVEIRVMDYKPEGEKKFLFPIPQICLYARMLDAKLKVKESDCVLNCYIFDKKVMWRFKPDILDVLHEKLGRFNAERPWTPFL